MARLLLEYKGVPAILEHDFDRIDEIIYITVYTTVNNDFCKVEFKDLEEAIDYTVDGLTNKLTFIRLIEKNKDQSIYLDRQLTITQDKISVNHYIEFNYKSYIVFSANKFRIIKYWGNIDRTYERRIKVETDNLYHFSDHFYQLFPRFENIFLETLFIFDILKKTQNIKSINQIEAFFLQHKLQFEKNISNRRSNKQDNIETTSSNQEDITGKEILNNEDNLDLNNFLPNYVGLDKIKLEIQELKALAQFRKKRLEFGLPVSPSTLHMIFSGNPGTGKTTVARQLGRLYHEIGLLTTNNVIEVSRVDLVGKYVGHTAPRTKEIFEKALGGILFIDEAYSLFKSGSDKDFGTEAVETLLKLMEDNREKIVLIIAGYPKEIDELLSSNTGLRSRFSKTLHFDDYSKKELLAIFENMVSEYNNILTEGARYKIEYLIDEYYERGYFNANARTIRNIFEETIKRQSSRLLYKKDPDQKEITTFIDKDIPDKLY